MLEVAATHQFRFDAVQMPLNVMDAHFRSFEHQVLPQLIDNQITRFLLQHYSPTALLTDIGGIAR